MAGEKRDTQLSVQLSVRGGLTFVPPYLRTRLTSGHATIPSLLNFSFFFSVSSLFFSLRNNMSLNTRTTTGVGVPQFSIADDPQIGRNAASSFPRLSIGK